MSSSRTATATASSVPRGRVPFRRFWSTGTGPTGAALLLGFAIVAIFSDWLAPYSESEITTRGMQAPSARHLMGTDNIGRDLFSLVIRGTWATLVAGLLAAAVALVLGAVIGALAGYLGRAAEAVLMRVVEMFQMLPAMVLALFAVALWGSHFWLIVVVIGLVIWPLEARIVYGQFLTLRSRPFVDACRVAGLSRRHIIFAEILPNALPAVLVQVAMDAGLAILVQAGLGFLGLGDPNTPSWGQILFNAQQYIQQAWWLSIYPGAAVCLAIIAFSLIGDGINEVWNPLQVRGVLRGRVGR